MFKLYQNGEKNFPVYIKIETGGVLETLEVNADFRNILRILAMLKDNKIPWGRRIDKLIQWFFIDPPWEIGAAYKQKEMLVQVFADFVNPESKGAAHDSYEPCEPCEQRFCYDFDAEEIYAGFMSEYGVDLAEIGFLHWYKFKIMLANLSGGSAFKKKIELRFMDLSGFRDKTLAVLTAAKEAVQIPIPEIYGDTSGINGRGERGEREEFEGVWEKVGV